MRDARKRQAWKGQRGMSSEGWRIWSIKIGCATSSINTSSFTLLMILQTFLTPLILIQQLTHYDSYTALRQYPTPHEVKSLDQVIFPFLSQFSHDESLCFILLLIFFLIYLIHHAVLKRIFWNFHLTHWWAITYRSQKCCLVILDSPHVYKEAVLAQRKDNQVQVLFLAQLSSARSLSQQSWLQHQDLSATLIKVSTSLITSSEGVILHNQS